MHHSGSFFTFYYGRGELFPFFSIFEECAKVTDVVVFNVCFPINVVVCTELAVGKYHCTIFLHRKDIFYRVVDNVGKQGNIVAAFLQVGNVLYVSFECSASIFMMFACKGFLADVVNASVEHYTIVDALV